MSAALHSLFIQSGRLRAFVIHLAGSAGIVGAIAALMLFSWYRQPWFEHDGGWTVFRLILLVDVVLGPLLTLIVYRRGKPELRRDLGIIVAIQLGALAFGVTTMLQHRPVFLVYAENNFFAVTWKEVREGTRDTARLERISTPLVAGLPLVYLQMPADAARRTEIRTAREHGGPAVSSHGDYYEPMNAAHWKQVLRTESDIEDLATRDPGIRAELERIKAKHPQPLSHFVFLPVVCRNTVLMLVFDRASMALVDWME
jgi:uncharacterized membrane protein